jgi:pimeloyl-ACP methyl ester carboxylesterase
LVASAWHGAWCWERIVPLLKAQGHAVIAPDLLGTGDDPACPADAYILWWADQIADIVDAQAEPVILVGHSRGGLVISERAERLPHRIGMLVYLTAFLVPSGKTLVDMVTMAPVDDNLPAFDHHPDGTTTIPGGLLQDRFYNKTAPRWLALAQSKIGPEPSAVFSTRLHLSDARFGTVPRAFIECHQDRAIGPALQRFMQQQLPCDPVFAINTDHSPFFSAPSRLATALIRIARALPP